MFSMKGRYRLTSIVDSRINSITSMSKGHHITSHHQLLTPRSLEFEIFDRRTKNIKLNQVAGYYTVTEARQEKNVLKVFNKKTSSQA